MALALALLAGAVVAYVVLSQLNAREALNTAKESLDARARTAAAATRRIDLLNDRIEDLSAEIEANGVVIGQLRGEIAALQEQIRQMGGDPVVVRTTTTTTQRPTPTTTPSTTTTTQPAPQEEPPDGEICLFFICIGA